MRVAVPAEGGGMESQGASVPGETRFVIGLLQRAGLIAGPFIFGTCIA